MDFINCFVKFFFCCLSIILKLLLSINVWEVSQLGRGFWLDFLKETCSLMQKFLSCSIFIVNHWIFYWNFDKFFPKFILQVKSFHISLLKSFNELSNWSFAFISSKLFFLKRIENHQTEKKLYFRVISVINVIWYCSRNVIIL